MYKYTLLKIQGYLYFVIHRRCFSIIAKEQGIIIKELKRENKHIQCGLEIQIYFI